MRNSGGPTATISPGSTRWEALLAIQETPGPRPALVQGPDALCIDMGEEIECPVDPATLPPSDLRFQLGEETLNLLRTEFDIPKKWQQAIEEIGDVECGKTAIGHTAMEPARG